MSVTEQFVGQWSKKNSFALRGTALRSPIDADTSQISVPQNKTARDLLRSMWDPRGWPSERNKTRVFDRLRIQPEDEEAQWNNKFNPAVTCYPSCCVNMTPMTLILFGLTPGYCCSTSVSLCFGLGSSVSFSVRIQNNVSPAPPAVWVIHKITMTQYVSPRRLLDNLLSCLEMQLDLWKTVTFWETHERLIKTSSFASQFSLRRR